MTINHLAGRVGMLWGISGISIVLCSAIYRLSEYTVEAFEYPLRWPHWTLLVLNSLFMAYSEGYRGFQKNYSPRVAARAVHLIRHPTPLRILLAPLFLAGYFHIPRARQKIVIGLTIGIIVLVILVRLTPQPWRGIADAGVVVGLSYGQISLIVFWLYALFSPRFSRDPEVVDG